MNHENLNEKIIENRNKYRFYINNHKERVSNAWINMSSNQECENALLKCLEIFNNRKADSILLTNMMNVVRNNIAIHDLSKFSDEEFEAYRKNFYPINDEEKENNTEDFEKAWEHHYTRNLHHWNWWSISGQKENMPLPFVIEMCCDWIAMSMYFQKNTALEWYHEQDNIILGKRQKAIVEYLLDVYYTQFNIDGTEK